MENDMVNSGDALVSASGHYATAKDGVKTNEVTNGNSELVNTYTEQASVPTHTATIKEAENNGVKIKEVTNGNFGVDSYKIEADGNIIEIERGEEPRRNNALWLNGEMLEGKTAANIRQQVMEAMTDSMKDGKFSLEEAEEIAIAVKNTVLIKAEGGLTP